MQPCCAQQVRARASASYLSESRRPYTVVSGCRPSASRFRTLRLILTALVAVAIFASAAIAESKPGQARALRLPDLQRIRTHDLDIARAVRYGYDASPTLRQIVQTLQQSNVVVYLDRHNRFRHDEAAYLRFAGTASGLRYVRVSLSTRLTARELTVFVAHELMHAVEIGAAEQVVDEHTLKQLYCRIGSPVQHGFDTEAARLVTEIVSDELDGSPLR